METKQIEINLSFTPHEEILKKLATSFFMYLLHSRSQIPFHFELFRKFVEEKVRREGILEKRDWKTEKQLQDAQLCLEKICALKTVIEKGFKGGAPMLILFGSTIHTVKESYEVITPESVPKQLHSNLENDTNAINSTLLRIIQTEGLKPSCQLLPQTNVFILFGRPHPVEDLADFICLESFNLSKSCKKHVVVFRARDDFDIHQDLSALHLDDEPTEPAETAASKQYHWMQSRTFVKGFKDQLVNNKSIWN